MNSAVRHCVHAHSHHRRSNSLAVIRLAYGAQPYEVDKLLKVLDMECASGGQAEMNTCSKDWLAEADHKMQLLLEDQVARLCIPAEKKRFMASQEKWAVFEMQHVHTKQARGMSQERCGHSFVMHASINMRSAASKTWSYILSAA